MTTTTPTERDEFATLLSAEIKPEGRRWAYEGWENLRSVGDIEGGFETVEVIQDAQDDGRWSRPHVVITKSPTGHFYRWTYDHGLTESQDDTRYYGPEDVVEVTQVEETVVVTTWEPVTA